jgi:AhpD family alkylhydroperoxidase
MPNLNVVDPASTTGTVREIFDGPLKGMHLNIFKGLGNSPSGLKAYLGLSEAQGAGSLDKREQEAVALAIGELNSCEYCLGAHTKLGTKAGLTEDQALSIRKGGATGDGRLDAIVSFARSINEHKGFVPSEDLEAFRAAGLDDGAVIDVLVAVTQNYFTNFFNHINDTELDVPAAPAAV